MQGTKPGTAKNESEEIGLPTPGGFARLKQLDAERQCHDSHGYPKAVQDQLRHKEARMTLRYLKTLSAQESIKIQQGVDFHWCSVSKPIGRC